MITPLERHQVIAAACRSPKDFDVARTTWSHASLRDAVIAQGLVRRISTSEMGRILSAAELKPHRVKGWCHSTDPEFQPKMRSIVRLYVRQPTGEPVLSIDEKTGMQALSRSRELQTPCPALFISHNLLSERSKSGRAAGDQSLPQFLARNNL